MSMSILRTINLTIGIVFLACYLYQFIYIPIVIFAKNRKKYPKGTPHKFACLIAARNESLVIGDLIDSIKQQTYPAELVTTFVIADNCTDNTAEIARERGAVVYERQNKELIGKGYAIDALIKSIENDYGDVFDGYFVFDADNVLDENFIDEMNNTFSSGFDIVTSYRNSKNYGDNWISAGYALWYLRESRYLSHARSILGTSCAVSGTGFLFSRRIKNKIGGWPYHLLTEDIEFSVAQIIDGEKIGFAPKAELYDEQPVNFKQSWNQRLRWSKGYYQVFGKYGKGLIKGMFKGNFSCFDMSMTIMPAAVLSIIAIFCNIVLGTLILIGNGATREFFHLLLNMLWGVYGTAFIIGAITTVTEWKKINLGVFRKIFYMFTFPLFMLTYIPITIVAIFKKVKWTPIKHHGSKSNLRKSKKEKVG